MKLLRYWIMPVLFCCTLQAAAQDKKQKEKDFDENEWRVIDSTGEDSVEEGSIEDAYAADTLVTEETDTAYAAEDETYGTYSLEEKLRRGITPYSRWDRQPEGDWDESAQVRLVIRPVKKADMEELRKMEALNYEKDENPAVSKKKSGWLYNLGAWVRRNGEAILWAFYISLGVLLLGALLLFIKRNDIAFRWSSGGGKNYKGPELALDEGPQNYDALARTAVAEGRLRDAVRFRYLHTLQLLEARQLIAPGKDKTNMDFLRELSRTAFHKPFAALTLHYEYVWYGKLPLSNGQFSQLDDQFAAFSQSIKQLS